MPLSPTKNGSSKGSYCASGDSFPLGQYIPNFFSSFYMPGAEEGNPGKAEILMRHEHSHRDEVWLTEMVYKAADVAIETSIYAVHFSILEGGTLNISLDVVVLMFLLLLF